MPNVIFGFLGPTLDQGFNEKRWQRWRPSIAVCMHPDLRVDRLELLITPSHDDLIASVCEDIQAVSPHTEIRQHRLALADPADFATVFAGLYDLLRLYPFDVEAEDYYFHLTTASPEAQLCACLLTESRHLPGRLLQTKPGPERGSEVARGRYHVIDLDRSRYAQLAGRFADEQRRDQELLKRGIATRNRAFNDLIAQVARVAERSTAPMLLTGPTGAGKAALARQIYALKRRRFQLDGRFVEVTCASLRGDSARSTLCGHVAGACTGAMADRPGLLRSADRGLLFLDEIGDLGADEQAMLLRAIEDGRFLPVGADVEVCSQFQLICSTSRDLSAAVAAGRFRQDLLARLNLWTFALPGLAERRDDIAPNLQYELEQFAARSGRRVRFDREARRRFLNFATDPASVWTGNFRDLNAAVTRLGAVAADGRISEADVARECERLQRDWQAQPTAPAPLDERQVLVPLLGAAAYADLDRFDRVQLADVVRVCRISRSLSDAGRTLFAASRQKKRVANDADRLRKYLARFSLDWERVSSTPPG